MFDKANEALKNWKSLLPMLRPLIKNETKNAVRRKKMNVATAPNGTAIGVTDPADTTVINIPYQPACANVSVGQSVWVEWLYDNFSTAIAVTPGDGLIPSPLPVSQGGTGRTNGSLPYRQITSAPTDSGTAFFFRVTTNFSMAAWDDTANAVTIPNFTHGVFVASSDAVMIGYDSNNNIYVAYRNNGTWRGKVIPSNPSVEYQRISTRYPASGSTTFSPGSGYDITFTVPSGYQILAIQPPSTGGFVAALESPDIATAFGKTGSVTMKWWLGTSANGSYTGNVEVSAICVKKY